MALQKTIRQDDGVATSYHRILLIQQTVNHHSSVVVMSYVDRQSREDEAAGTALPYRQCKTFEMPYDEGMTPSKAYDVLKELPEFEGAEDV